MRALQISGLVLIAIGIWFIIRPPSYSREESVFKFGDVEARMQEQRSLPGWVGGVALGAGLVLVAVGFRRS
jgi:cytochrome c biogenesis protein CcdA